MNARRYRLIYSEVQGEYIPVPEVTLSHICVIPGVSGSRAFPLQSGVLARILGGLVVGSLAFSPGQAQTVITPDGRTQTTVTPSGSTTAVTTGTIRGTNAFNSFSTFNVGSGDTVNLYLPGATQNLINIVRDEQTNINGILNAIKDGRIGGNVWFANPFGFVVGQNGIVNVGSLTVATPTPVFVQNFFSNPDASAAQLLAGTAPRSGTGQISIQGQVNAVDGIALSAGIINVGGSLYSGARFTGSAPDFTDVVNVNGLVAATNVIEKEGRIQIVADTEVTVSGVIATPGGKTEGGLDVGGGAVTIQAGGSGTLAEEATGEDAKITLNNATLLGGDITLEATANYTSPSLLAPVIVLETVHADVDIHSSRIEAAGNLTVNATSTMDAATSSLSPLGTIAATADASVNVDGASVIKATGNAKLNASSTVTAKAQPGGPNIIDLPGDAGVAINVVTSTANAHVSGTTTVNADGALEVTATNTVTATTKADATAGGALAVGGTVALSEINTTTKASIDEEAATQSGTLKVAAESVNTVETSAKAAAKGATKKGSGQSKSEETLENYKDQAATTEGCVEVAAAVAVANVNSLTQASITSNQQQTSTGVAVLSSKASNTSTVVADGSSVGGTVGVGAAVGLNIGVLTNVASIGDNTNVTAQGLTVSAVTPTGLSNAFSTTTTSGAGAGNVGVAGSLAANVVVNSTVASLEGDTDNDGAGAQVDAGTGDVLIEAGNATTSTVKAGAKVEGTGGTAKVGVGASVGMNVAVNTTVAEIANEAVLTGGHDLGLNAKADHTMSTEVTGGASGAKVAITPVAAVSLAVNTTMASLGASATDLGLTGAYSSRAEQTSKTDTVATGQTQGDKVAVGASIALTIATDTVTADVERNITADNGVTVEAESTAKSTASATASVAGGAKENADGTAGTGDPATPDATGKTVDEQVATQGDAAKEAGKKTAATAPTTPAAGGDATAKLDETTAPPTTEEKKDDGTSNGGGVSVAAAVGVNVGVATTTASIAKGTKISSSGGALSVSSAGQTDAKAKADGSQVNGGNTDVGVGAAVALNLGVGTNVAVIGDNADVDTKGVTVKAVMAVTPEDGSTPEDETSEFGADATSGAGANNVGVAGSLAVNAAVNTTVASIEGDTDGSGAGANVNATTADGAGDVLIEAQSATSSTVVSGAVVDMTSGKVGVGASVGMNVVVNTTVAEIADKAVLSGGNDLDLNAKADHTMTTTVEGGAAGAKVSITPLAAVSMSVNTTTARLGSGSALDLTGAYSSSAEQTSAVTTVAKGQTQGDKVAVGVSLGLTVAVDTVTASVERDIDADQGVSVNASSVARSSTSATASVAGGAKENADGSAGTGDPETPDAKGKTVDEQVKSQSDAGKGQGKAAAAAAPTTPAAGGDATAKLDETKAPPKGETSEGGVTVAAAVGVNVGVATTTARIGTGRKITSSAGALKVASVNETDTSAKADGSQVDGGNTKVGVGAAVALNAGVSTNTATIADNSEVKAKGVTVSATGKAGQTSDSSADAKSGAGAGNVGVAGSLAVNAAVNTTVAKLEGDKDSSGTGATVDADDGTVLIEAQNATTSTVKAGADVKMSGENAKVGVGASVGLNVAVNTTVAEVEDKAQLINAAGMGLNAKADHTMSTTVEGGAAGAKVSVTPVAAISIGVNTTTARLGASGAALNLSGAYSSHAEQTNTVTTKATGQAQGDVAVGASLAATIAVDNVSSTVERNISSSMGLDLAATSGTSITTEAKAGAKGAKAAAKNEQGEETPETGSTVDEQKKNQLDFAKSRNTEAAGVKTDTPEAKTPDTSTETPDTKQPTNPPTKEQQGKKVSVAAAIGVSVAYNEAKAEITAGQTVNAGTGELSVHAGTDTNYRTLATGEAVSDDVGVAAAVALTATYNKTQANLGAGSTVTQAGDIDITATSTQNRGEGFRKTMSAEAVSGASGGEVAVAGSLAVVGNYNETRASIDEGATIGKDLDSDGDIDEAVGDITVKSDDTSKVSAQARAGALSTGDKSKAGVGASFAVLLSYNQNTAAIGYDADKNGSFTPSNIRANSLTVNATKNRVWFETPTLADAKNFVVNDVKNLDFDALDPSTYLGSNNYYTEAIAGAAAKGNAAVAGAFSINVFGNTTEATLGDNVNVTTEGKQATGDLGVEISSLADTQAISFSGAVAGAKKAGVGISNTDIVNLDQTSASIGDGSTVISEAANAGVKVSAESKQDIANVSVSAGIGTESTGVGGVLGVIVSLNKTEARIGDAATVQSEGDVAVKATNDTTTVMVSGGVGGGKEVGVGAAVAANIVANKTVAEIGKNSQVDAKKTITVAADADETAVTAVVAGAGGGKVGVAAGLSINVIVSDTEAQVGEGAKLNTNAGFEDAEKVAISAQDDTVVVGIAGGGAGAGDVGVGASLDTTVLAKTVKAFIADDTLADGQVATVKADKQVSLDATASESIVSVAVGFGGGGKVGVGGAVSIGVVKNDVQATIGKSASVDSDGNVLVNAQDDITAVLTAGTFAGGGQAGVGGSLAVATLLGSTKASVADNAQVNARGNHEDADVYTGETVFSDTETTPTTLGQKKTEKAKGLSITAYNRENLITTVIGGAGGGTAGVAATVSANVIASKSEASIGQSAIINGDNTGANENQQVRVKAVDETLLINSAGAGAGGGTAGVGAAANVGVIAKTTTAKIGKSTLVNARKAVELNAASSEISVSTTIGLAGGGSAGVGGAVGAVGVANTTQAYIEDVTTEDGADDAARTLKAAKVNVTDGDLALNANDFASTWLVSAGGGGGGAAGVGGALSVGVNASTTKAKIGDYAETNASGTTAVHADSTENANSATIAGAGGGSAGVSGAISLDVVVSKTEAGIGKNAQVNQDSAYESTGQTVDVKASDRIITVGAGGAGAGGGAAGVGGTADVTVALNTTSAYIDNDAKVSATKDVKVDASSEKYVNSVTFAGAGGGAAGVAGAVSVISVGSLLDGEAKSGLSPKDEDGNASTTQGQADGQTTKSAVGYKDEDGNSKSMLGESDQSKETTGVLNSYASKLAVSDHVGRTAPIEFKNTQAFIGKNAEVKAGENVTVSARDKTLAIVAAGAGAGGGAAGVAGSLGVVLLHDSAEAFIADGAQVDAGKVVTVAAETSENVFNVGITGSGAGAAAVSGSVAVNVVSSDTAAYVGAAQINQKNTSADQSVAVTADSASNIVTVAANGGGAGAAAVGGVLAVNTLLKTTKAYIGEGANVAADKNVDVSADSAQNIISGSIAIHGAGAAAVSGVAAVNVIANTTEAFIGSDLDDATKSAAVVDSNGNVTLSAVDDSLVVAVSAAGNGAGAAGVGVNVGANVVSSQTRAYVAENSTVNARGNADSTEIYNGAIDDTTPTTIPEVEGVGDGSISNERNGTIPGNVKGGVSFDISADGGDSSTTVDPTKGPDGTAIPGASGGLGTKGKQTVKGLSVVAMGNEKMITATVGVAGAGAAAVTGAATANVISTVTEATIGDGAQINQSGATGTDSSVRVGAADNTFMVQVGGTFTGAGAAAVSGSVNTGIVTKTTTASIGDADVEANNVAVAAESSENIYTITANVSIAGAAGVGAAVGVDVVTNATTASIGAGANIDATGDIRVNAKQDTAIDLYTVAGAGGIAGVSGALSVGVIDNTTKAYLEGATLPADAATLNAGGTTEIKAASTEDITSVTVSAAGGGVGVAGAIGVKVVKSETAATIGDNTQVNQTRDGVAQDVIVSAADTVKLSGGGGSGAVGAFAGVGATADIDIVRNTTTATIGNSTKVNADRDVSVTAASTKDVQSAAIAAAGGGSLGIGGAVSVVSIGAKLDADSQGSLQGSSDGKSGDTASFADGKIKEDQVSSQLGNSEHVQQAKTASSGTSSLGIAADLNMASPDSLDKTQASIGSSSEVTAGRHIKVSATDKMKVDINAVGAAGGFVGIGGAVGVGVVNSTTEAFVGASAQIDADADGNADGDVTVEAKAENIPPMDPLDPVGSEVRAVAGAGGIVGASAAVAVMNDTSATKAYLGTGSEIQGAKTLSVTADTTRQARADAIGASVGGLAIGASVARANFAGTTSAYAENSVKVGKTSGRNVNDVLVSATDDSTAIARATAGSAGIYSGSGADAKADIDSTVDAHLGTGADLVVQGGIHVDALGKASADAGAFGVSAGLAAVGVSLASAKVTDEVLSYVGADSNVTAGLLEVSALTALPAGGVTTKATTSGASGGLIGANGTESTASYDGSTSSSIGSGSTIIGSASVTAATDTKQVASASGLAVGIVAAGGNVAKASSDSATEASLGTGVTVSGDALKVAANGTDDNYAAATSGSGGLLALAASIAETDTTGSTKASIGDGTAAKDRSIVVKDFDLSSEHTSRFNARTDSITASLVGGSGTHADNDVTYEVETAIGKDAVIKALTLDVVSINRVRKDWLPSGQYNVNAGSGGAITGSAAKSESDISITNATKVGSDAELEVIGDRYSNPGTLRMDGLNDVVAYDRAKLDAGGAIAVAKAESIIRNTTNDNTLEIGSGAKLTSVGNIDLAVRSDADIQTNTNVKTYGAAGAAAGNSVSRAVVNNSLDIKDNVAMLAYGDMNLRVGSDSSGNLNQFTVLANTDLWNKTAFPVETKPDAEAYLNQSDQITLGSNSLLQSAGNMRLLAERGDSTVQGYGVGKDLYREVLAAIGSFFSNLFGGGDISLDIHGGSSTNLASTGVRVDGQVEVGINNKQQLYIKSDGTVDTARSSDGITVTKSSENLANSIQQRINELDALITQVAGQTGTASTSTNPQASAEISNLQTEKSGKNTAYAELGGYITTAQNQNYSNQQTINSNNANIQAWLAAADYKDKKAYYDGLIASAQAQNITLQAAIDTNNLVNIPDWTQRRTDINTRILAINNRIAELQATLGTDDGGTGVAGLLEKYQAEKAMLEFQLAGLGDTSEVGVVKVDQEIVARSSNIYIKADDLTGSGALRAPGDTLIEVKNESPNFLRTNKMTIPDEAGGRIYYNSAPVSTVEAINARNRSQTAGFSNANIVTADSSTPIIRVLNSYIPYGSERAPDIFVDGDIRNLNGNVEVISPYGSVLIKDGVDVVADTISIAAGRDVTIGYKDGFRNIGGDIKGDWAGVISGSEAGGVDRTDTRTPEQIVGSPDPDDPSILAGNNVFIAGQYLNINGIVQSGIPLRTLTIPATLASEIAAYKALYDANPDTTDRIYKGLSLNTGIESDIRKIAVFYDAKDNVLELAPVTIMGGYMELFGHIMNTGSGELRLMDGYGTIDITNNTGYQLRLNTLSTGSGIEGTLKITDTGKSTTLDTPLVTVIKRLGNDVKEFNNYSTGSIDWNTAVSTTVGRSTNYAPLANQYYSWTTLDRATWSETANYYEEKWFGFTTSTQFSWGGTSVYNRLPQVPLGADVVRVAPGHTETYWYDRTQYIGYTPWTVRDGGHWYNDVWALLYTKYHQIYDRQGSEAVLNNHNIAAFHPITINFLGNDTGLLTVNSVGGLILDGQIKNTLGNTTLSSSSGSILQGSSEEAKLIGQYLSLNAAKDIGTASSAVSIGLVNSGFINAETAGGNVNLKELTGTLIYDTVKAGGGDVSLSGDTGIFGRTSGSLITGNNVLLSAEHGAIGTAAAPVQVDTLDASTGGLAATSATDLFVTEQTGDLYLVKAESLGGDVHVTAGDGAIIDNNAQQTEDTRARNNLLKLYDDMLLTGDKAKESADQTVGAYERQKEQEYATYWKYRMRQTSETGAPLSGDVYDPNAKIGLTTAERAYYATTLDPDEITALEDQMTADYHALHASYGSIGNAYSASWTYTVERPKDGLGNTIYDSTQYDAAAYHEWDTLVAGHSWTQAQLDNSISLGTLKEVSDTETRIEDPNAKGRNITLTAGGAIGHDDLPFTINIEGRRWSDLSPDEKVALMAAERDDIEILSDTEVKITQREDVDIEALGTLTATANGNAYLGSEADIKVASITTGGGNLRLKGQQGIYSGVTGVNITAHDAILEAGDKSIGESLIDPLVVDLSGSLTARAGDNIFLRQAAGNMNVDTVFAVHGINLESLGSILAANGTPALDIRGENLYLKAQGSAGAPGVGHALDIGLDATGKLTADIGSDLYVNSPTRSLTVDRITAGGDVVLTAEADIPSKMTTSLTIDGTVTAPGRISLTSGGQTIMTTKADVHSFVGDIDLRAGALAMEDNGTEAARLRADLGIIDIDTVGDAVITGLETGNATIDAIAITSTAGHILDGGDTRLDIIADTAPDARLTISAPLGIGEGNPLEVRLLNLDAQSDGLVALAEEDSLNIVNLTADALWLSAPVSLTASNPLNIGSNLELFSDRIDLDVNGGPGIVGGSVTGFNGGIASNIRLGLSSPSGFAFTNFRAAYADVNQPLGWLSIDNLQIQDRATFTNPYTRLLVDQHVRTVQPYDVQLYSGGVPFAFKMRDNLVDTTAYVIYRSPMHEVIAPAGKDSSSAEQTEDALTRSLAGQFGSKRKKGNGLGADDTEVALVTFTGLPVSLEGE